MYMSMYFIGDRAIVTAKVNQIHVFQGTTVQHYCNLALQSRMYLYTLITIQMDVSIVPPVFIWLTYASIVDVSERYNLVPMFILLLDVEQ
jgi:hypothetical protein